MPRGSLETTRRLGITLVELVIVVLIIGIFTAVAVPRFADSISYHRAEAAAKRIKVDMELARRQAMMSSTSQSITFDPSNDSYTLTGVRHLDYVASEYAVKFQDPPYEASIVSADFAGTAELTFDGYGVPQSPGAVVVQAGPYQRTITVEPETGKVGIQ